jgi:ribosomal protein S26
MREERGRRRRGERGRQAEVPCYKESGVVADGKTIMTYAAGSGGGGILSPASMGIKTRLIR